jgi:hypothetical protein
MRKQVLLALSVISALLLLGCYKSEPTNREAGTNRDAGTSRDAGTNRATNTASPASSPAATAATNGDKIGVPECDDFIVKYDACVSSKVPEAARAQYKATIEQWRKSWKTLAANPQTKATLAKLCKDSAEQARQSMKSFGCTF